MPEFNAAHSAVRDLLEAEDAPGGVVDRVFVVNEGLGILVPFPGEADVFDADLLEKRDAA
jgi:hypothetical protein